MADTEVAKPDRVWVIVAEPQGKNPGSRSTAEKVKGKLTGKNEGGVILYLETFSNGGSNRQEVGRVAFDRSQAAHPDRSFKAALSEAVQIANDAAGVLNTQEEIIAELKDTFKKEVS